MSLLAGATDKAKIDKKIKEIVSYLDKPGGPGSDGKIMFALVLEVILDIAPETSFPPEFISNMKKAKDIADSTSLFNPEGVAHLHKAYRTTNDGKDYQIPGSISKIQDAVDHAKLEFASAREDLKADKTESCVKRLLGLAVMIVTPMHKEL